MTASARHTVLELLAKRTADATICPSEVARAMTGSEEAWRDAMPMVHAAVDALLGEGQLKLSWKGAVLTERNGPYRIGRK